jgi:hypothetical protein
MKYARSPYCRRKRRFTRRRHGLKQAFSGLLAIDATGVHGLSSAPEIRWVAEANAYFSLRSFAACIVHACSVRDLK